MDVRTGQIYDSRQAALLAGADEKDICEVDATDEIVRVQNGPFKGRCYERLRAGRRGRRRRDLENRWRTEEDQ